MASGDVSYFGIRHHGPGSAASLLQALQELKPAAVLIEGPADASALLPLLARPEMQPPVALLCYPEDDPAATSFWPFAEFSPEYQATFPISAYAITGLAPPPAWCRHCRS